MTDISSLKKRIAALREKTTARGCTEAEALSAAEKVAAIMKEYQLSESDLSIGQASVESRTAGRSVRDGLWDALSVCTNTAMMILSDRGQRDRVFIGRAPGPEVAAYLYAVLDRAVDQEIKVYKQGEFYKRRRTRKTRTDAVRDFTCGLVARLTPRLMRLFADQRSPEGLRQAVAARDERYPSAVSVKRPDRNIRFNNAANEGYRAGEGIHLSHGMNGTDRGSVPMIGVQK